LGVFGRWKILVVGFAALRIEAPLRFLPQDEDFLGALRPLDGATNGFAFQ
jgi:hypothetical protein